MATLVVSLDGATFSIVNSLIAQGKLRNFKAFLERGVSGELTSTLPPVTAPAWTAFATGMNPGRNGITGFSYIDQQYKNRIYNSSDVKGKFFYEILAETGKNVFIANLPLSYPYRIEGDIVGSWLESGVKVDGHIRPATLIDKFPFLRNMPLFPSTRRTDEIPYIKECTEIFHAQFDCLEKVVNAAEYDFIFWLFSSTDWVQHRVFREIINPKSKKGEFGRELWRQIDQRLIGFLLEQSQTTDIILLSDHGFKECDETFFINKWLETEGFLQTSLKGKHIGGSSIKPTSKKANISFIAHGIRKSKSLLKIARAIYSHLPLRFKYKIHTDANIDMNETVAFAEAAGNAIYINDDRFCSGRKAEAIFPIINGLQQIEGVEVYNFEELYGTRVHPNSPDILIYSDEYALDTSLNRNHFIGQFSKIEHAKKGIFAGIGPSFKCNVKVKDIYIWDIAPTILFMENCYIPDCINGKVLMEIFDSKSTRNKIQIKHSMGRIPETEKITEKDEKKILNRLKELGYM